MKWVKVAVANKKGMKVWKVVRRKGGGDRKSPQLKKSQPKRNPNLPRSNQKRQTQLKKVHLVSLEAREAEDLSMLKTRIIKMNKKEKIKTKIIKKNKWTYLQTCLDAHLSHCQKNIKNR